jgi:hypothetical protein
MLHSQNAAALMRGITRCIAVYSHAYGRHSTPLGETPLHQQNTPTQARRTATHLRGLGCARLGIVVPVSRAWSGNADGQQSHGAMLRGEDETMNVPDLLTDLWESTLRKNTPAGATR